MTCLEKMFLVGEGAGSQSKGPRVEVCLMSWKVGWGLMFVRG